MVLSLACPDWWQKLQAGKMPVADLELNTDRARSAVKVFNKLRLPDVPGQPTLGESAAPWFSECVALIFGTVDDDGNRWVGEFLEMVPKKNSKTTKGAAIMLTALLLNERPRGEFFLIGPTQAIAETSFRQASGMIDADPYLRKLLKVKDYSQEIEHRETKAVLKIVTFDNKVMTGTKPVGVLVDELHVLGKNRHAIRVIEQIRSGINVNPEGFLIFITTQSDEPPTGVFKTELEYAREIRDGNIEGNMLPILYEFPLEIQASEGRDWLNEKIIGSVHPNLGKTRFVEKLLPEYEKAAQKGIDDLSIWLSQNMNIEIGISLHKDRWVGVDYWNDAADPEPITLESLLERSEVITAGVDGGGLDDLLGFALCGRDKITKDWLFWHRAWVHEVALEKRKKIAAELRQFEKQGDLVICTADDPTQDIRELSDIISQVFEAGLFPSQHGIGLDAVGVAAITDEIAARGVSPDLMVAVAQGYRLNGVIKGFERKLMDGTLWHDGSDLMRFCVGNARTEVRGSATMITKQVSGTAKIDPLIGAFNAFFLMSRNPESSGAGVGSTPWDDDVNYKMDM